MQLRHRRPAPIAADTSSMTGAVGQRISRPSLHRRYTDLDFRETGSTEELSGWPAAGFVDSGLS
jgi:hypothetical protein